MRFSKEVQEVIDYAKERNFVIIRVRKHIIMRNGRAVVSISRSPSCQRTVENTKRDIDYALRKNDIPWPD